MDENTKQLEELIKLIKDSVQSQQLSLSIQSLKCPLCDFSSNYNSSLKKHVSSIHGDPETCCGICKKYFKRSMLEEHKQLIHSYNGREFKCSLCDYLPNLIKVSNTMYLQYMEILIISASFAKRCSKSQCYRHTKRKCTAIWYSIVMFVQRNFKQKQS